METPSPVPRRRRDAYVLAIWTILFFAGVTAAVIFRWSCDDSFISIRYADNLVNGLGLVYNAGEYVEGYTNLLWTLLIALAIKIGFSPVLASQYMSIVFYAALAVSLALWSFTRARSRKTAFIPLASGLVLISNDFHVWATGGLETMLFAFLATVSLMLTRVTPRSGILPAVTGCLFGLLTITRPDGVLLAGVGILSYWTPLSRFPLKTRIRHSLQATVPFVLTLVALVVFKLSYYGDLFPTAFYSKSVMNAYFSQGLVYLGTYLAKNWFLPVSAIVLLVAAFACRQERRNGKGDILVFLAGATLFLGYLVHVGGDFMFARRIIPVVPLIFLVMEEVVLRNSRATVRYGLAFVFVAAAAASFPIYGKDRMLIHGIANERRFYPPQLIETRKLQGEIVGRALADTDARVAFEGGMCVFGYYSRLPYLVELTGLTQYSLAKQPITERGPVGHEKKPSGEWLKENRIQLVAKQAIPRNIRQNPRPLNFNEILFGTDVRVQILLYSDDVMDSLRNKPGIFFVPIETIIEKFRAEMENSTLERAENLFKTLNDYYFREADGRRSEEASVLRAIIEKKRADFG